MARLLRAQPTDFLEDQDQKAFVGYYWLSRLSTRVSKTGCHSNYYFPFKIIVHKCITDRLPMDYQISSRPAYQPLTSLVDEPVSLVMAIGNVI